MLPDPVRFAVGTFTRIPVAAPSRVDRTVAGWGLALGPVVATGLGIASGAALALPGADPIARLLAATVAVSLAAWLTRALHWDGLADLADGLGSGAPPERAVPIMRRPDLGTFGVLTLILTVALQVLGLAALPAGIEALAGWVLALALSRLALALAAGPWSRAARPDGLGAGVVGAVRAPHLVVASALVVALGVCVIAAAGVPVSVALAASGTALAAAAAVQRMATRRLGGLTGDVLGATAELTCAAALLAAALVWSAQS
jgi:adenosylcobinamide-GDP ribazoletransferase